MNTSKFIGKGTFSRVYLMENNRVMIRSTDPIKECMAHGWFPESRFFPEVSLVDYGVYEMEYYPRASSLKGALDKEDYALYQTLRTMADVFRARAVNIRDAERHSELHEVINKFEQDNPQFSEAFEALREAVDACGNYGTDIGFEVSPRNVAVKEGKLILLDVFYMLSALRKARK